MWILIILLFLKKSHDTELVVSHAEIFEIPTRR